MSRFSIRGFRSLMRDEDGNVFILFGAAVIPLVLFLGGAVDITRYNRHKTDLANALDAAALSLGRQGMDWNEAQAKTFITNHIAASGVYSDPKFWLVDYTVKKTTKGFYVDADATMKTIFLPLTSLDGKSAPLNSMQVNVDAEVVHSSNRLELALVIDNTGSMNCGATLSSSCTTNWSNPASSSRIKSVNAAAKTLVDTLMRDDLQNNDLIKIGLVPFEGMVNVASPGFSVTSPPSWIAWSDQGKTTWDGSNFDQHNFGGSIGTKTIGHKWLFNKLTANDSKVKWAGCVEMRAGAYELSDAAPDPAVPDSLYVPYFWPDEPDGDNDDGDSYPNNYLDDQGTFTTGSGKNKKEDPAGAQKSLAKYNSISWNSGKKDTTPPYESGPNTGCPQAISPLRNAASKAAIKASIDDMIAYPGTGTFIPTGLVWGWHVVSPGIPYTEGLKPGDQYYDKTVKAIVLFTDGDNSVTGLSNHNRSYFSAFNYVSRGRMGTTTSADTATDNLDTKTSTLCENVKAAKIRLYTISFGTMSASSQTMMRNCATLDKGARLYYHAPATSDLQDIFNAIGQDLSEIHLSM
jgi:Flp pilus assembly protein TadG